MKGTKVAEVEDKLKARYGTSTRAGENAVYGTLNKLNLMRGNKPTKKGLEPAGTKGRKR